MVQMKSLYQHCGFRLEQVVSKIERFDFVDSDDSAKRADKYERAIYTPRLSS